LFRGLVGSEMCIRDRRYAEMQQQIEAAQSAEQLKAIIQ
jgi:hypothetical protein